MLARAVQSVTGETEEHGHSFDYACGERHSPETLWELTARYRVEPPSPQ
jgi:hypothetical protein